jgi:acyl transferase domain-containing protein
VVLRRLSDARSSGDPILAVVRGSAVNHDGRSSGLTAPNGLAQQALLRQALRNARAEPHQVAFVETHGTGTVLGDPIEARALGAVLGEGRTEPLLLGSVKANIGHLEAAAGVASLIKVVLALGQGELPPQIHFRTPNPHVPWDTLPLRVPTAPVALDAGGPPGLAGVSAFGISGTNAHVILERAPAAARAPQPAAVHLLPLSARSVPALRELAGRYVEHLAARPDLRLDDLCHTAAAGRSHLPVRAAFVAGSTRELQAQLAQALDGGDGGWARTAERAPKPAFLFTGQGAQYPGMGQELYRSQPVFRAALDTCAAIL